MKNYFYCFILCFAMGICLACQKNSELKGLLDLKESKTLPFDTPVKKSIDPLIAEVSGIADSKKNPGFLWAQEDSGNPPNLILLSHDGTVRATIPLLGATNTDWEDMALAGDQLYIADIGDNQLNRSDYVIYQFPEPSSFADAIETYNTIRFKYSDGPHDAEAFLVDPGTKDIYIITKADKPSQIFKLSYPQNLTGLNTATKAGALTFSGVVSAALSTDAKSIIVKTYLGLRLYYRRGTESLAATLGSTFINLSYQIEPQGEAVTFAADNSGFYTLSEKGMSNAVNLYFYRKK